MYLDTPSPHPPPLRTPPLPEEGEAEEEGPRLGRGAQEGYGAGCDLPDECVLKLTLYFFVRSG